MKREKIIIGVMLIATLFIGCVPKSKYDELVKENENLKIEVDELKNGEERLITPRQNMIKWAMKFTAYVTKNRKYSSKSSDGTN
ncbi:MAG: hypothetical protein BKP49_06815 [Treponema sp. CETP13]|nr:MAG: hypothetical protein BKP49_06815 [Treponema sp. CETP13]